MVRLRQLAIATQTHEFQKSKDFLSQFVIIVNINSSTQHYIDKQDIKTKTIERA
jgi:hypothetical protein